MPWTEHRLRGQLVLAKTDERGQLVVDGGRVEVRYRATDGRAYQASPRNLDRFATAATYPDDHCAPAEAAPKKDGKAKKATKAAAAASITDADEGTIVVYADGACTGNPGPAGLGVVIQDAGQIRELSEYLGQGTNNIGELTAILRAAEALEGEARPVEIRTDSKYAIGVLTQGWKAKANQELIASVKAALETLKKVKLTYVPGHAGVAGNERADTLARSAVSERKTQGWTTREGR